MIERLRTDSPWREAAIMVLVAAVLLALPWILAAVGGYRELATRIIIWAIFALGFDLLVGFTGYLSFGHAAFWGIGAYCAGYTLLHGTDNALIAIAIGTVAASLVAVVLGYLTLRRHGIYFAVLTLAFAEMFYYAALSPLQQWTGGDNGLTAIPTPVLAGIPLKGEPMHWLVTVCALVAVYAARRIARSPFGLMLHAIKSNETRLRATGIDVYRYKITAFAVSGVYAGLAGTLYALYETYVPTESLHWVTSGKVVMMSVIGGLGTLFGPMIGAGIVLYLENVLSASVDQWLLIEGLIFMGFVIFLPGGIMEGMRRILRLLGPGREAPAAPAREGAAAPTLAEQRPRQAG
jgi:branched-chain amino acid transport system permease protein